MFIKIYQKEIPLNFVIR